MLFNSIPFFVFLVIVYTLYRVLPFRAQNWMLLAASYIFYGWWDVRFLFLMIFSTSIDFWTGLILEKGRLRVNEKLVPATFLSAAALVLVGFNASQFPHSLGERAGQQPLISQFMLYVLAGIPTFLSTAALAYRFLISLPEERRRRTCMILSIVTQLTVLGFFKYYNFFTDSMSEVFAGIGIPFAPRYLNIILPVGISFYTFQSMSYAIDIYRREMKPTDRFFDFALFVSFFPQLVAGPIERARQLLPQMSLPRVITADQTRRGLFLILFGLFKKVAIADGIAGTVDTAFAISNPSWATVAVGTLAFAIQIYCDFSGYTDIARGVAKLFGVELMINFDQPYFARSPREFWQRWHISLSTWLGDYLYKPLGGNRGSLLFTCRNLMITMILGGLWHGAAWNYVLWGFYHGSLLSIHRVIREKFGTSRDTALAAMLKIGGFGLLTLYGWLLFRSRSLAQVVTYSTNLFAGRGGLAIEAARPGLSAIVGAALLAVWELAQFRAGGNPRFYRNIPIPIVGFVIALMVFLILMGTSNEPAQFIYFQF